MWQNWVTGILGIWILVSPFVGFSPEALQTNLIVSGILIAILGFSSAGRKKSTGIGI